MAKKLNDLDKLLPMILGVIRLVHTHLNKRHRQELTLFSPLQIHTLGFIKDRQNPLMKEVADFLAITPASATSLIDGLVGGKLLKRLTDSRDRRTVRLSITPKGQKIFNESFRQMTSHMREIYECLTPTERKQMMVIYQKIFNYFKKVK